MRGFIVRKLQEDSLAVMEGMEKHLDRFIVRHLASAKRSLVKPQLELAYASWVQVQPLGVSGTEERGADPDSDTCSTCSCTCSGVEPDIIIYNTLFEGSNHRAHHHREELQQHIAEERDENNVAEDNTTTTEDTDTT